jgi:hypothetical protein
MPAWDRLPLQHELIFVFKSGTGRYTNNAERNKSHRTNVWKYDRLALRRARVTIASAAPDGKANSACNGCFADCSYRGDVVLDCSEAVRHFGGGTDRPHLPGIELDPRIDTAIRRWQNLTGRDAIRCADGKLFREIEAEKETLMSDNSDKMPGRLRAAEDDARRENWYLSGRPKKPARPFDPD